MDREDLARRLIREREPFAECRRAVLSGAPFWISGPEHPTSASALASIYARRHEQTTRRGIPTVGFARAVDALRAHDEQLIRVGAVDVQDPPYHYQLFLTEDLTTVVAILGVDQHLGYRLRTGEKVMLSCEVVGWVREEFPGWVVSRAGSWPRPALRWHPSAARRPAPARRQPVPRAATIDRPTSPPARPSSGLHPPHRPPNRVRPAAIERYCRNLAFVAEQVACGEQPGTQTKRPRCRSSRQACANVAGGQ
jgi:hypothetical protein